MSISRTIRIVLVSLLPLLCLGCPPTVPRTAIVGTWQTGIKDKIKTQKFWENSVWSYEVGKKKQTGTYKFLSDDEIEIKVDVPSDAKPIVYKRKVRFSHHDLLNTVDVQQGQRTTWRRVEGK